MQLEVDWQLCNGKRTIKALQTLWMAALFVTAENWKITRVSLSSVLCPLHVLTRIWLINMHNSELPSRHFVRQDGVAQAYKSRSSSAI